ncbi:AraC family transcriptional regulator [Orbus wheelerorum]|uniref:AraC family transcriptional regulator n=1 Tax=Orbus wheelerorum TaxID=3074111 RepID=UPI00370D8F21
MTNTIIRNNSLIKLYKQELSTLYFLSNITTDWHSHPSIQLCISLHDVPLELEIIGKKHKAFGFIIQSNVSHKLNTTGICCMNFLVNPESPFYHLLSHFTENSTIHCLNNHEALKLANYFIKSIVTQQSLDIYHICGLLGGLDANCVCRQDNRIIKAAAIISSLHIKQISSREIAAKIHLSESRFLHLFRSKLGVNFRGYLLWQRLQDVLDTIDSQFTLTTLANDMGFSDSAHFSRTCLSCYGLRPSELKRALIDNDEMVCNTPNRKGYCLHRIFKTLYSQNSKLTI